jgi:hypothetical protein
LNSIAQTGPGGVGNTTSNLIWVKADEIPSLVNDDLVTSWPDFSGNSNNLDQPSASFQPIFKTSVLNGRPVVRFNKAANRLRKTSFTSPTSAVTAIYVNSTTDNNDGIISYASAGDANDLLLFDSDNIDLWIDGSATGSGINANDGAFHIINTSWQSSDGSTELWKDGNQSYTATFRTGSLITTGGSIAIANEQDAIDGNYEAIQAHDGDFAEVILFNTYLNEAQHIIVANYLAAKYGLTISNDYYSYQASHEYDVAGIGREDVSNTHTVAQSDSILQIGNPSDLNVDQEYLIFGHENGDVLSWTTIEAPDAGVNIQRIAREWRIDETGDLGTVDFTIDTDNLPTLPVNHTMYALMIDSDGDFSNGALVYEMVLAAGSEYEVTGIEIADGDFISIAVLDPKIHHSLVSSNGFEPNNASIEISLNFIPESNRTVDFTTADGTALEAQPDYSATVASTATITAGNQTVNYSIAITNDVVVEPSETFTITLSNPSAGIDLGTNTVHTYTINDDDDTRKIYYNLASSSGPEATSPLNIAVSINNVDGVNPTTVDYTVTGGTASGSGTDYTLAAGTLTILAGSTTGNITLTINNDALYELDETIIITLSNPTNCNLDGIMPYSGTGFLEHTYTITSNDVAPEIEFDVATNSGSENVTPISIQVNLNILSGEDASASYTLTGTATGSSTDYTLANGTITIVEGDINNTLSLIIIDDDIEELSETVVLTLSVPVNSTLGPQTSYTYTIIDNDDFGYLGPGGVGDLNSNKIWVKPEDLVVVSDGTDITTWIDASGNSNDLSQSNASFKPRYYNNIVNSLPIARFDQADGRLIHNNFNDFPSSDITTYFVNRNSDSGEGLVSYASSGALNNDYLLFNSSNIGTYLQNNSTTTSTSINGNIWRITNHTWRSSDGQNRMYLNGTQTYSGVLSTGNLITTGGTLALAGEQDAVNGNYDAGQAHQGDFAEFFIYDIVLNNSRKKIIDNYLSAKYNLTISNDMYSYDSPGNYEHEVAGIGKDDNNNFHLDAQGTGIVRINNPSSLDNGDYLFWGHNNAASFFEDSDVPPGVDNRTNKVWRLEETGDIGTVTLQIDLGEFTIGNSSDLVILIDTDDGLFVNSTQVPITSYSGNVATFQAIEFSSGDYFSVGSTSNSNALPVEFVDFSAILIQGKVELSWATLSEINNDFFTIERTVDGINWQQINTVEGAGNSNVKINYKSSDKSPLSGISYYRIKQTDYDGKIAYSKEKGINNTNSNSFKIYPNPFKNTIVIEAMPNELQNIEVYSLLGINLSNKIKITKSSKNRLILDLSNLEKGVYIVKSDFSSHRIIKK